MTKKLKGLFITHDTSNYGASRSLQMLLNNYRDADIDLAVMKVLFRKTDRSDIRSRFGEHIRALHECYLPYDFCIKYKRRSRALLFLLRLYARITWYFGRNRLYAILKAGKYDFVHLNSLVLHELISGDHRFIIHVRDIFDGSNPRAVTSLQTAAGVIFIDEATLAPFGRSALPNSIVLNNPYDMTACGDRGPDGLRLHGLDVRANTIFSMIGVLSEEKGTEFVIRAFMQMKQPQARLLIVGGRELGALTRCRKIARHDERIIFWGEETDIAGIYAVSDYIIRGEPYHCIGRTIYEGLYAGCRVIVPGTEENARQMFEYETFRNEIYTYPPRNAGALLRLFEAHASDKVTQRQCRSNVQDYVRDFHDFIVQSISRPPHV